MGKLQIDIVEFDSLKCTNMERAAEREFKALWKHDPSTGIQAFRMGRFPMDGRAFLQ